MALYYYINTSLSRIKLKKNPSGGKRKEKEVYITVYIRKIQYKDIAIYIEKIQSTSGQKRKEERFSYIEKYNKI